MPKSQPTTPAPSPVIGLSKPAVRKPRNAPPGAVEVALLMLTECSSAISSSVTAKLPLVENGVRFSPVPSARSAKVTSSTSGALSNCTASFTFVSVTEIVEGVVLPPLSVAMTAISIAPVWSSRSKKPRAATVSLIIRLKSPTPSDTMSTWSYTPPVPSST